MNPVTNRKIDTMKKFTDDQFSKAIDKDFEMRLGRRSELKTPKLYVVYYAALVILFWVSLAALVIIEMNSLLTTLLVVFQAMVLSAIALNATHAFMHQSVFKSRRKNLICGWISTDLCIGVSSFFWHAYHNENHHPFCQMKHDEKHLDPDHKIIAVVRSLNAKPLRVIALCIALSANFLAQAFIADYVRIGRNIRRIRNNTEQLSYMLLGKTLHVSLIAIPLVMFKGLDLYLAIYLLASFISGLCFLIAHTNDKVAEIEVEALKNKSWKESQIITTANYAMSNRFVTLLHGGLNYQIEHHLYPYVHPHFYPEISRGIKELCKTHSVPYCAYDSFGRGVGQSFKFIYQGT